MNVIASAYASEVFSSVNVLSCRLVPYSEKDGLQRVHLVAVNAAVHVAPFSHLWRSVYVIVCHVHTSRIGYLSVYYHNLTVVAMEHMINPREAYGVEFMNLDATLAYCLYVLLEKRLVV